ESPIMQKTPENRGFLQFLPTVVNLLQTQEIPPRGLERPRNYLRKPWERRKSGAKSGADWAGYRQLRPQPGPNLLRLADTARTHKGCHSGAAGDNSLAAN